MRKRWHEKKKNAELQRTIELSSFGTDGAKRLRTRTPDKTAKIITDRVKRPDRPTASDLGR